MRRCAGRRAPAAHAHLARYWPPVYFGADQQVAPPPAPGQPRLRLVIFSVSSRGSFGPGAHGLLSRLAALCGHSVPRSLLEEATWAAPRFGPFARMAISTAVRRQLSGLTGVDCVTSDEADALRARASPTSSSSPLPPDPRHSLEAPASGDASP